MEVEVHVAAGGGWGVEGGGGAGAEGALVVEAVPPSSPAHTRVCRVEVVGVGPGLPCLTTATPTTTRTRSPALPPDFPYEVGVVVVVEGVRWWRWRWW